MKLLIKGLNADRYKSCQDLFRIFYEDGLCHISNKTQLEDDYDFEAEFSEQILEKQLEIQLMLRVNNNSRLFTKTLNEEILDLNEVNNQLKRMARLVLYRFFVEFTGEEPSPWGILTGIRPTKIVHRLIDKKWSKEKILEHLITKYQVSEGKAYLLVEIAFLQRKYLLSKEEAKKIISVYIGIPFCPTRCAYCSFPAYSLAKEGKLLEPFLEALEREIEILGRYIKDKALEVQTIYLGGGTPTSLNEIQLKELVTKISTELKTEKTIEFTVEAGRPDSITETKLRVLKEFEVNRISINPQTMKSATLESIGRNHSPEDIVKAFKLARSLGFNNINMDLIMGLPGENIEDVKATLDGIESLSPENITVHTLAIKRASKFKEEGITSFAEAKNTSPKEMLDSTMLKTKEMGMRPYYLYRQKQIKGQLENIGFAKEGYNCLYNIQMMEERQTIIGLGAGSASKFINPEFWTLESFYNPKDPLNYIERIEELITKKLSLLSTCL